MVTLHQTRSIRERTGPAARRRYGTHDDVEPPESFPENMTYTPSRRFPTTAAVFFSRHWVAEGAGRTAPPTSGLWLFRADAPDRSRQRCP